jgi:twinkle protein
MGQIVTKNQPCINPECGSSDARQIYDDGTSYCFSCSHYFSAEGATEPKTEVKHVTKIKGDTVEDIRKYSSRGFADRKISKTVCEFFNVKVSYNDKGEVDTHYYPYSKGGYKVRKLPKTFSFVGKEADGKMGLFGKENFQGGGKRLIITEGEIDALSVAQATFKKYSRFYPVISLSSATGTKDILEEREWVRSFKEVVLCLDNDKAGKEATQKLIKIIGIDKVKIWNPGEYKDANEVLVKLGDEGANRLNQYIWDAMPYSPAGIVKKEDLWKALTELENVVSVPYPPCLEGLNLKLKGMRLSEIVLIISGTGQGKSTIVKEIMLHVLETTPAKIGVISLEESPAETARRLSGMQLHRNTSNEDVTLEDLKVGFDAVFGEDRVLLLDHQGSIKDSSIVDQMEYMCLMGCEYLFIDHITILVSEGSEGKEGNEAIDLIMNHLLRLVNKYPVWIGLISHLRKAPTGGKSFEEGRMPSIDDIRGSGSIKQVSHSVIGCTRNSLAEDELERNTMQLAVLKCRHTGLTGRVNGARYNNTTGRLVAAAEMFDEL